MRRAFAVAVVAAALFLIPSAATAAQPSCSYDAGYHQLNVPMTGNGSAILVRDSAGNILMNGIFCPPGGGTHATVKNTDLIVVTGDSGSQSVTIELSGGGLKPGFTNEKGTSDEIELSVILGSASDTLTIDGTDAVNKIDLGQRATEFGLTTRINLNAGESTGVDADVVTLGVESIVINAKGGNDVINGRGLAGTGPDPVDVHLEVHAGDGNDTVKGGEASDTIYGDAGTDTLYGYGTGDSFRMDDGAAGDTAYGGAGVDDAIMDVGDHFYQQTE